MGWVRTGDITNAIWRGRGSPGTQRANTFLVSDVSYMMKGDGTYVWSKYQVHEFTSPGITRVSIPYWALHVCVVMFGGGQGGSAGNGGNGQNGKGGGSGRGLLFDMGIPEGVDSMQVTVGSGGKGGKQPGNNKVAGQAGTETKIVIGNITRSALGGDRSTSGTHGESLEWNPLPPDKVIRLKLETKPVFKSQGGTFDSGHGVYGGGGAAGRGGIFGHYTPGGNGGDGIVRLAFWGKFPP